MRGLTAVNKTNHLTSKAKLGPKESSLYLFYLSALVKFRASVMISLNKTLTSSAN